MNKKKLFLIIMKFLLTNFLIKDSVGIDYKLM